MWSERRLACVLQIPGISRPGPQRDELHAGVYGVLARSPSLPGSLFVLIVDSQCHLVGICGLSFSFSKLENPAPHLCQTEHTKT